MFNNMVLRIGERFTLLGDTVVEKAAARQWIQYWITRLSSIADKRELDEVLHVSTGLHHYHCYHDIVGIRCLPEGSHILHWYTIWSS